MQNAESRGVWGFDVVKWTVVGSLILFAILALAFGFTEEGVRHLMRWSARISLVLFILAFSASSVHDFIRNSFSWWLRVNRKYFGISFAIIHLIHLGFVIELQLYFHPVFDLAAPSSIFGGSVAYFFVVTMLLTSFEKYAKYLSRVQWKILHTIGGYWIWTIFLTTYYKRTDEPVQWLIVIILVLVLLLKMKRLLSQYKAK